MADNLTWPAVRMAKFMDIVPSRLRQLAGEGVVPKAGRDSYEPFKVNVAYIRYLRDRIQPSGFKPREAYAKEFGVTAGAIDNWIKRGRLSNDPAPLDSPELMPDWWARHMKCAVPTQILSLAANKNGSGNGKPPVRDFSQIKSLDIDENVQALRLTLAINKQLLDEAFLSADERVIAIRQRNYENCFNLMRLAETTLTELQQQRGSLIDREKVLSDQTKIVETLKQMRERMTRDVMIELEKNCGKRLRRVFVALALLLQPAIEKVRMREELIFSRGLQE